MARGAFTMGPEIVAFSPEDFCEPGKDQQPFPVCAPRRSPCFLGTITCSKFERLQSALNPHVAVSLSSFYRSQRLVKRIRSREHSTDERRGESVPDFMPTGIS